MAWGTLANAVTTGVAALAYGVAAVAASRRQHRLHVTSAAPLLFFSIAVYLAIAAARQVAAWLSGDAGENAEWVDWDRRLYYVVLVPAAFVIVPHVHLVSSVAWGSRRRSLLIAALFFVVVAVGVVFAYVGGIDGPDRSAYGTDWTMRSGVTKAVLVGAIMLPGLVGSVALTWMARRLGEADRRRVALIGTSCLVYFFIFTLDALGLTGGPLLFARVVTAGTGILAVLAYRRPRGADAYEYVPPKGGPDEWLYQR